MIQLLLGECPECEGPRKYTTDGASKKRLWLKCPSPVCVSNPKKLRRSQEGAKARD
jgi:hypothetical protein